MLIDEIKARMFKAMKAGQVVEKEILRVAVGEITTDAARPGKQGSDEEAQGILRKLIKSNQESLALVEDAENKATLQQEIEVLSELLPKGMSAEQIAEALGTVADAIRAAGNDGQATGIAMKHLKSLNTGAPVSGTDVAAAVKRLRS